MNRHLIKAIGLILLLVIVASDRAQVMHHLRISDYHYLIPVILLIIPNVALRAWRGKD